MLDMAIKQEIVKKLQPLGVEKIILFGSHVYGDPTADSDLDICVIEKKIDSKTAEKRKIRSLLKDIKMPKDILLEEEAEFQARSGKEWINTALYDIRTKGEVIYEKS